MRCFWLRLRMSVSDKVCSGDKTGERENKYEFPKKAGNTYESQQCKWYQKFYAPCKKKQVIALSKQDDSLAKMAQQKSVVSAQKATGSAPESVTTNTAVPTSTQTKASVSETSVHSKRFDTFIKEADHPASSPSGIYSPEKDENGKTKIVTDENEFSKGSLRRFYGF